jgi:hypothetical protein
MIVVWHGLLSVTAAITSESHDPHASRASRPVIGPMLYVC